MTQEFFTSLDDQSDCPKECPFLGMRIFLPDTLPFYCNKYETFLGGRSPSCPLKCSRCMGQDRDVTAQGCAFIDAYHDIPADVIADTKKAFLKMSSVYQRLFVDLVAKTGAQIVVSNGRQPTPEALLDAALLSWSEKQALFGSPEACSFKAVLDQISADFPLMARETQTLLMNLFMVMDNSEKEMLKHILQNPRQVESFLDGFAKQPQDRDLLRNMRALLYDYDRREKTYQNQLEQQRQQDLQRAVQLKQLRDRHQEYER